MTGPLCNAGACASILAAIAERDARMIDRWVGYVVAALDAYTAALSLAPEQVARIPAARAALAAVVRANGGQCGSVSGRPGD